MNNILSNAIKYTKEGSVKLEVKNEELSNPSLITFTVTDTGLGIRPEDMKNLFSEYTRIDTKLNRTIEGTGLGLSISKKLVDAMGGSITVESEYGKGSAFSVSIVQETVDSTGIGEETAEKLRQFLYINPDKAKEINRIRMPYGKVLIVDDLPVNLKVACGLLEPYGLQIDTAESGQKAIDLIKSGIKYDLVFMDHLMPDMDGIEAVRLIREFEKEVPIVALTANALTGTMEMFLSNGFNGFIPKPIDIFQLDEALNQWVLDKQKIATEIQAVKEEAKNEKTDQNGTVLLIQGLDTQHGISMTGGTKDGYINVLSMFSKDAQDRLPLLQTMPSHESLTMFVTQVHALKSASYSIGAAHIAALAEDLERAGIIKDLAIIEDKLPGFTEQLTELITNIKAALKINTSASSSIQSPASIPHSLLEELAAALDSEKVNDISRILKEIETISGQQAFDSSIKDALDQLSNEVMMVEYENAKKILIGLLEK